MTLETLQIPDGIFRAGTEYGSKGHWYDANLVRFRDGVKSPVGGWRRRSENAVTGVARCMHVWNDNSLIGWIGIGTHEGLFLQTRGGVVHDITPTGFVAGRQDAAQGGGWGTGAWGRGTWGTRRRDVKGVLPANVWSLDHWGENLVGVFDLGTRPYEWVKANGTGVVAQEISTAPVSVGLIVTDERHLMAIGCVYDGSEVSGGVLPGGVEPGGPARLGWSDKEDNTDWDFTSTTNEAGFLDIKTKSELMAIVAVRGGYLLLSRTEAFFVTYRGTQVVYGYERVGDNCGVVGRKAVAVVDGVAYWRGVNGFYMFNGVVEPIRCDVWEFAKESLNVTQSSKFWAMANSENDEVWWFDVVDNQTEINRYFYLNVKDGHWSVGRLDRTAGFDSGVFRDPLMVNADGYVYEHELASGFNYDGATAYLESGPLEVDISGERTMTVKTWIPDEKTSGSVDLYLKGRFWPNLPEFIKGPYDAASPAGIQAHGRQFKVRFEGASGADFRIGDSRFDIVARGKR